MTHVTSDGNFAWAYSAGGSERESAAAITTDGSGGTLASGSYRSSSAIFGGTTLARTGSEDCFFMRVTSTGIQWAIRGGPVAGGAEAICRSIVTDGAGGAFVTGSFTGAAIFGTQSLTASAGNRDAFILRMSSEQAFAWAIAIRAASGGQVVLHPSTVTELVAWS